MKGIALTLLYAVALSTAASIQDGNSCLMDASIHSIIAHENCNQYYQCVFGKYQTLTCPGNLMYNTQMHVCDWPQNVNCGERLIPEHVGEDNEGSENNDDDSNAVHALCRGQDAHNKIMEHDTCNKFYICSGGSPIVIACPDNLLYNPELKVCDWPQNVVCKNQHIPHDDDLTADLNSANIKSESEVQEISEEDEEVDEPNEVVYATCAADESEGIFVEHERCDKFYMCTGGLPVSQSCPDGLLFNVNLSVCDWRLNVECGDRTI